ncbi:hypothetical protein Poly30_16100 [Planctomycetes bacterium Poly30]|uniref:Uncharacterized protein n=1 Tax=Saltatorellus ferox TaxID=2528018 RepID=A0A518EPV3_9BACT|nr:hypothetical protein Poly30_16100 [Planctomycetes bacterium Poly30]
MTHSDTTPGSRDHGPQPLGDLMAAHGLKPNDLVEASMSLVDIGNGLTHKMVSRGVKGRQLTRNVMTKILDALNHAAGTTYGPKDAFNYLREK